MFLFPPSMNCPKGVRRGSLVLAGLCAICGCRAWADPPIYTASARLDLGGDSSTVSAEYGGLAGTGRIPGGETHAFLFYNGQMIDLGTMGGTRSGAGFFDSAGDIVGGSQLADGHSHAFLYQNGVMTDIGNFPGGTSLNSGPIGVDSTGQIALNVFGTGSEYSVLWQNNQVTNLGTLGGSITRSLAINSYGEVVGYSATSGGATQAFVYSNGAMTNLAAVPGVVASATGSESDGVAGNGLVAGAYFGGIQILRAHLFTRMARPSTSAPWEALPPRFTPLPPTGMCLASQQRRPVINMRSFIAVAS